MLRLYIIGVSIYNKVLRRARWRMRGKISGVRNVRAAVSTSRYKIIIGRGERGSNIAPARRLIAVNCSRSHRPLVKYA